MSRGSWTAFAALVIFTMGTSIITPLLPLYQGRHGLSNGELTLLFATYTATVVPTMLVMGNLSDLIGRRRVMLPAMAFLTAASLLMGFSDSVALLFTGRVLQGIAVGGFLGVGTAFVVDHAAPGRRELAAVVAGIGFRLGFGLGPGLAGIVAQVSSEPTQRPFQAHALLMGLAVLAVLATPETIRRGGGRLRVGLGVPSGQLLGFATFLAPAAVLVGFLDATMLSVAPLYLADTLDVGNVALIGLTGFLVLGLSGFTPLFTRRVPARRAVRAGVAGGALASLLVVAAGAIGSPAPVLIGAAAIGLVNGLLIQGCTAICGVSVPIGERGKLISALYTCAYAGTIPTVVLGYLSQGIGLTAALWIFSLTAIAIAAFVLAVGSRIFRQVIPYSEPAAEPLSA